ncbi:unnamed protein product [Acanthosepion pharaonis]|uniref:Transmembrane protein n=1 Tax=Acanthosepion pharaonis TaxID=158019 RepID=A0A812EF58_ACAPH|nr:unnamed protein product [Sepia pharaonis]
MKHLFSSSCAFSSISSDKSGVAFFSHFFLFSSVNVCRKKACLFIFVHCLLSSVNLRRQKVPFSFLSFFFCFHPSSSGGKRYLFLWSLSLSAFIRQSLAIKDTSFFPLLLSVPLSLLSFSFFFHLSISGDKRYLFLCSPSLSFHLSIPDDKRCFFFSFFPLLLFLLSSVKLLQLSFCFHLSISSDKWCFFFIFGLLLISGDNKKHLLSLPFLSTFICQYVPVNMSLSAM